MKNEYITERASALKANSILASYWLFDIWRAAHKYWKANVALGTRLL